MSKEGSRLLAIACVIAAVCYHYPDARGPIWALLGPPLLTALAVVLQILPLALQLALLVVGVYFVARQFRGLFRTLAKRNEP